MPTEQPSKQLNRREMLKLSGTAIGAAVIAGCAPMPASAPLPTQPSGAQTPAVQVPNVLKGATINFMGYSFFVPRMNEILQSFALDWATQNNVKFNLSLVSTTDLNTRVATAIETKQGPTLVQFTQPPASIASGLVDLSDLAMELGEQQEGWYPVAPAVATVDGKWHAIPMGSHTPVFAYREDWFKEAGIERFPDTWDEFYEAGKKMKAAGRPFGFVFGGQQTPFDGLAHALVLLWSFGGKEFLPDGTVALDSPETLTALDFAIKLQKDANDPGATAYNDASNNQGFLAGTISATMNVNTIYLPALTNNPDVARVMNHALPPAGPAGRFAYQGFPFMGILNHAQGIDREAALAFMTDFFAVQNYAQWIKEGRGYLIPLAPIFENLPIWDQDPKLAIMREVGKLARWGGYAVPSPTKLSSVMVGQFTTAKLFQNAATTGNARQALDETLAEIENLRKQVGG
ncbi:MAG: extracellular solute-binding protein [Anaerolineae bacterium]|nr:extracellular solute-binding protein [Anaerolineae bacterium]